MRKNYVFRTAMCLGIAAMLTLCGASGTYAKYTGQIQSSGDTARVAKFDFSLAGTKLSAATAATINLFDESKIMDEKGNTNETDVLEDGTNALVAPGTWGYVTIVIKNEGETTIHPVFELTTSSATYKSSEVNTGSIPIKYWYSVASTAPATTTGVTFKSLDEALTALNTALVDNTISGATQAQTCYLMWYWDFADGTNDTADSALGLAGTDTVTVTLACTANQVN